MKRSQRSIPTNPPRLSQHFEDKLSGVDSCGAGCAMSSNEAEVQQQTKQEQRQSRYSLPQLQREGSDASARYEHIRDEDLSWVYDCSMTRESACTTLLGSPWLGQEGCYLVRQKIDGANELSFVVSLVDAAKKVIHFFVHVRDGNWVIQHGVDRPLAPSSVPLAELISMLKDPRGKYALRLATLVVPEGTEPPARLLQHKH